jgi:UDP-N-acetylglucosamine--N-acetylmuramyl-(pentapeptide) pyrophosphoryl-undecaprenol N-acetylglucosamine transferase
VCKNPLSMATSVKTVVIAGGGTGGHLIPGLAVAGELVSAGVQRIVFIGTSRGIETSLVPQAGFELRLIEVGGLKNVGLRRGLATLWSIPKSILESRRILNDVGAQVVFGIGGYASGPVLVAAALVGVPVAVLEVNAKTGLANRLASRWVRSAAVNFPETARDFPHAVVTGVPVRAEFFAESAPDQTAFGPRDSRPRVLVFGGSRGARAINAAIVETARIWSDSSWGVHLIHQTGAAEYNLVHERYVAAGITPLPLNGPERADSALEVRLAPFIENMAPLVSAADIIICRSGASTLGELAAAGKGALLIPFPQAADNHQLRNARAFERAGAAVVLEQAELTPEHLAKQVRDLAASTEQLARFGVSARKFARPDAAKVIARLVLQAAEGNEARRVGAARH